MLFNKSFINGVNLSYLHNQFKFKVLHAKSNSNFDMNYFDKSRLFGKYIANGAFGQTHEVNTIDGNTKKYAIKIVQLDDQEDILNFNKEVKVGKDLRLSNNFVAVSIYAFTFLINPGNGPSYGIYIMDHIHRGMSDVISYTMDEYLTRFYKPSCPLPGSPFVNQLEHTLLSFYKITKGYHGDLHTGNMCVVTDKHDNFLYMLVYDYGAFQIFKNTNRFNKCSTLNELFNLIQNEFQNNMNDPNYKLGLFPSRTAKPNFKNNRRMKILQGPFNAQAYRSNVNILSMIDPKTAIPSNNYNKITIMNMLTNSTKLQKKRELISQIANFSQNGTITIKRKYANKLSPLQKNNLSMNSSISVLVNIVRNVKNS